MKNITRTVSLSLFAAFLLFPCLLSAQAPGIKWAKSYGGGEVDFASSAIRTSDGGYALVGSTNSANGDVTGQHGPFGKPDLWVVKIGSSGNLEWQKCLGGSNDDRAASIIQTSDGGYALAGFTNSTDGDVSGNHGQYDAWVVKLDPLGAIQWQKCLGGAGFERAYCIVEFLNGYIVAAQSDRNDGNVSGNHGRKDAWIIEITLSGDLRWQQCYGGTGDEDAFSITKAPDGGYVFIGYTDSQDGDVSGNHGPSDVWVVKIGSWGTLEWQKCLGGTSGDGGGSVTKTSDGGYAIAGGTYSSDGDVSGKHGDATTYDAWVVKLSSSGSIEWQKCLGGTGNDGAVSIVQTTDGGYAITGSTSSIDGDVSGNHGSGDVWAVKLNKTGTIEWQKCLGGSDPDRGTSILQAADGSIVVLGNASSPDIDGNHGLDDFWVVKLKASGNAVETSTITTSLSLSAYPNPATKNLTLGYDLPKAAADVVISISDVTGRRIEEIHADGKLVGHNEMTLDLSRYSEGTYYVTVRVGDLSETTSVRVVK